MCIVDASGKIVREIKVASEPEVLVEFFKGLSLPVTRIGLEAGPLSQWLHAGLSRAGFETVLLETRHVKVALSAMSIKTDRNDARGIAQLMRMGWFRPVHAKSVGSREARALLVARKQLLSKLMDLEANMRGILRGFGLKMGVGVLANTYQQHESHRDGRELIASKMNLVVKVERHGLRRAPLIWGLNRLKPTPVTKIYLLRCHRYRQRPTSGVVPRR